MHLYISTPEEALHAASAGASDFIKTALPNISESMMEKTSCTYIDPLSSLFTGCSIVVDYTAHAHLDRDNMVGGATAVMSFNRELLEVCCSNMSLLSSLFLSIKRETGPKEQ